MTKDLKKRILTSIALFLLLFFAFINNYVLGYVLIVTAMFCILEFLGMTVIILKKYKIKNVHHKFVIVLKIIINQNMIKIDIKQKNQK